MATFTQRSETTPSKSQQQAAAAVTFETIDSGARSFPHIPESSEGPSSSSTTTTTTSTSTRYTRERIQMQQVGDEHMFHQKVCMLHWNGWSCYRLARVLASGDHTLLGKNRVPGHMSYSWLCKCAISSECKILTSVSNNYGNAEHCGASVSKFAMHCTC